MQEQHDIRFKTAANERFSLRAVLLLTHDNEILISPQPDARGMHYILPGGAIKFGESSLDAAQREAREELALTLANPEFIGTFENIYPDVDAVWQQVLLVYRSEVSAAAYTRLQTPDYDHLDLDAVTLRWVDRGAAMQFVAPQTLRGALGETNAIVHYFSNEVRD